MLDSSKMMELLGLVAQIVVKCISALASGTRRVLSASRCQIFPVKHFTETVPSPDTIIVNDKAVQQMTKVCTDGSVLRITVEGGGCSGFQYLFALDEQKTPLQDEDICIRYKNVQIVIDNDSLEFVRGSTLDYNTELIRSAFRLINNPKAESGCSCGASFAIKD